MNTTKHLQWLFAVLVTAVWIVLMYDVGREFGSRPILVGLFIVIPFAAVLLYLIDGSASIRRIK